MEMGCEPQHPVVTEFATYHIVCLMILLQTAISFRLQLSAQQLAQFRAAELK
jgi:hypothetical protein